MKSTGVMNAVKRSIAAVLLLIGVYMFTTATDLSKIYAAFRPNSGFAPQLALLVAIGVIIVSVIEIFAAQYAGANYFSAIAYLCLSLECMCYYMSYSFYKDMIVFSVVFGAAAVGFYILAKLTPADSKPLVEAEEKNEE